MSTRPNFTWPIRAYYEDTDASGVVYHASYLRFFERARTEWLRARGHGQEVLRQASGLAFTVANIEVDFVLPARLDDELEVTVQIEQIRGASLLFAQTLQRKAEPERVLARARVRVACVDYTTFRPRPLPAGMFKGQSDDQS
jgi:acyl-CoA thioester hydrolase